MKASVFVKTLRYAIVILLLTSQVDAAGPLRLKLSPVASNIRSDAPLALNVHLDWASTDLLEGRLELTCYDGKKLLHRNVGSDVALLAGDRHSRTVLPPMSLDTDLKVLTVNARFLGTKSNYDLGSFEFRVPVHWKRSFVIGVLVPNEHSRVAGSAELGQALRFERLSEKEIRARELVSVSAQITPDDLRASGLGLFSFNVLALTTPGFKALDQSQLDAIAAWVEAGGSLFVVIDSTNSTEQKAFLNRIAGVPDNDPGMVTGADRLPSGGIAGRSGEWRMYRPGLGRSVILQADEQTHTSANLKEAAAFLWKLRNKLQSDFRNTGRSSLFTRRLSGPATDRFDTWQTSGLDSSDFLYSPFQHIRLPATESLTTILLPDAVGSIPLSVVVLILGLFLTAIVPVDYLVLGQLNCRRFTWIFVPVVALMFTGVTTWLGKAYLGSTDYRTSLEIVDLTTGNRVIRSNRFEMLFTATQREAVTELKQTLYTELAAPRRIDVQNSARRVTTSNIADVAEDRIGQPQRSESSLHEGNMPTLFTVRQQMRKWSPRVSRHTALQTERPIPQFSLDDIGTAWQQSSKLLLGAERQGAVREKIQKALPESTVLLFHRDQVFDLSQGANQQVPTVQTNSSTTKPQQLLKLVRQACVRPAVGLFSIVSQISPNGAGNFEDLSILDPDDASQLLLVIVARQGNDYVVFRRMFHKGS